MIEAAPWTDNDEALFRRELLLNAPERVEHLAPHPRIDWQAAISIREMAPPASEPYRGKERRRS